MIEVGGALSIDDLKTFKPQWVKPISMDFAKGFLNKNKVFYNGKINFKDKTLIIRDKGTHYTIKHNINGAPLFLSKGVV